MQSFKDSQGRTWDIAVNAASIQRVRNRTKVNLYTLMADAELKQFGELYADPAAFSEVIFNLSRQADQFTDEEFLEGIDGDAFEAMREAFQEAIVFFSPKARRDTLRKIFSKIREVETGLIAVGTRKAEKALDELDVNSLIERLSSSSGSLPDRSASTPDLTPSAS